MIVLNNQTQHERVRNQTINGFNFSVMLEASAANSAIPLTGYRNTARFDPSNIQVEITLMRNNVKYTLINSNLAIVGQYMTMTKNQSLWLQGITLRNKAAGVNHLQTRNLFVYLGGHYNLKGDDEITCTVSVNRGTFGTSVNANNSSIQFEANTSIGIEYAIHRVHQYAIGASQDADVLNLGDNVTRIALVSFNQDHLTPIFKSATLGSDRLDWTANEQQLVLRHWDKFPYNYMDNQLLKVSDTEHPLHFPHSYLLHDVDEIDKARLQVQMDGANVVASQNYIVWTTFITSAEMVQRALNMKDKHDRQNLDKIPLSV